jgi:cysteine desulfurase / selenocysteine lyase
MSKADDIIYLNNAATTFPKSELALKAFWTALTEAPAGARHGTVANDAASARAAVAGVLRCRPEDVFFLSGATLALNVALRGVLGADGFCAVDNRSHNSILRTLENTSGRYRVFPLYRLDETIDAGVLRELCAGRPRAICLTHASNVSGSVYELDQVISRIREWSPLSVIIVDASQSAGCFSLREIEAADIIVFPAHKHLHAPAGAAVMKCSVELSPIIFGGTGSDSARLKVDGQWRKWLEVGTPNDAAVAALAVGLCDGEANGARYRAREEALTAQLWGVLSNVAGIRPIGRPPSGRRIGTIACRVDWGNPELEWTPLLRHAGVVVRGGLHCSPTIHRDLGLERVGTLRFSLGRFNTPEQIELVGPVLQEVAELLRRAA